MLYGDKPQDDEIDGLNAGVDIGVLGGVHRRPQLFEVLLLVAVQLQLLAVDLHVVSITSLCQDEGGRRRGGERGGGEVGQKTAAGATSALSDIKNPSHIHTHTHARTHDPS